MILNSLFFEKIILTKIYYKTYNGKYLALIKFHKTWRYNLASYKYITFMFINHNNI